MLSRREFYLIKSRLKLPVAVEMISSVRVKTRSGWQALGEELHLQLASASKPFKYIEIVHSNRFDHRWVLGRKPIKESVFRFFQIQQECTRILNRKHRPERHVTSNVFWFLRFPLRFYFMHYLGLVFVIARFSQFYGTAVLEASTLSPRFSLARRASSRAFARSMLCLSRLLFVTISFCLLNAAYSQAKCTQL